MEQYNIVSLDKLLQLTHLDYLSVKISDQLLSQYDNEGESDPMITIIESFITYYSTRSHFRLTFESNSTYTFIRKVILTPDKLILDITLDPSSYCSANELIMLVTNYINIETIFYMGPLVEGEYLNKILRDITIKRFECLSKDIDENNIFDLVDVVDEIKIYCTCLTEINRLNESFDPELYEVTTYDKLKVFDVPLNLNNLERMISIYPNLEEVSFITNTNLDDLINMLSQINNKISTINLYSLTSPVTNLYSLTSPVTNINNITIIPYIIN